MIIYGFSIVGIFSILTTFGLLYLKYPSILSPNHEKIINHHDDGKSTTTQSSVNESSTNFPSSWPLPYQKLSDLSGHHALQKDQYCEETVGHAKLETFNHSQSLCSIKPGIFKAPRSQYGRREAKPVQASLNTTHNQGAIVNMNTEFTCYGNSKSNVYETANYCTMTNGIWITGNSLPARSSDNSGSSSGGLVPISPGSCAIDTNLGKLRSQWYNTGLAVVLKHALHGQQPTPQSTIHTCKRIEHRPLFIQVTENRPTQGNVGHEFAGLYSLFLTRRLVGIRDDDTNTLILNLDTPSFKDKWGMYRLFSSENVKVASDMEDGVCYSNIVYPMTASDSPYWTIHWITTDCHDSLLFNSFLKGILDLYGAQDIPVPTKPRILWVDRADSGTRQIPHKNAIQQWLQPVIASGNIELEIIQLASLTFQEQVKAARRANIMIASNGSGMMLGQFLADEAVVIEVQWKGGAPQQFRNVMKLAGKDHFAIVSEGPELDYDSGRAVPFVNVSLDQLKEGIRAGVAMASGYGSNMYLTKLPQ